ncbi:MAG: hypothetical protein IPJ73_03930 [Zoogloea sp.]|nr:hypothetical protein [Zoogloea sp.]
MPPGGLPAPGRAGGAPARLRAQSGDLPGHHDFDPWLRRASPSRVYARIAAGAGHGQGKLIQRNYGDIHVRIEKHRGGPRPIFKSMGWLALFIACFIAIRRSPALKACHATLHRGLKRIYPIEFAGFLLAALLIYGKPGIIDMIPLGEVIGGIREGINFYTISTLQGQDGHLIFPYNPPAYFLLGILSEAHGVLTSLGLPPPQPHALLQLLLFLVYAGFAANLSRIATDLNLPLLRGRTLYYFILLNPLGLYYTVFLGQIDLIAIALLMAGSSDSHARGKGIGPATARGADLCQTPASAGTACAAPARDRAERSPGSPPEPTLRRRTGCCLRPDLSRLHPGTGLLRRAGLEPPGATTGLVHLVDHAV